MIHHPIYSKRNDHDLVLFPNHGEDWGFRILRHLPMDLLQGPPKKTHTRPLWISQF